MIFGIDYMSFTFPKDRLLEFREDFLDGEQIQEKEIGFRGYKKSATLINNGRVGWSDERPEIHFDLSGKSLNYYFKDSWEIVRLIQFIVSTGGNISRLDYCIDVMDEYFVSVHDVEKAVMNKDYCSRTNTFKVIEEFCWVGNDRMSNGKTVYVGSRKSQKMLRVYDKAKEQGIVDREITRFELMLRDESALAVSQLFVESYYKDDTGNAIKEAMLGVMRAFCDFVDRESDTNSSRRIKLSWWEKIVSNVSKIRLVRNEVEVTIEKIVNWVDTQVAPSLAVIKAFYGDRAGAVLNDIIQRGAGRFSVRHQAILKAIK